jgi:hypothetical protein
MNSSEARAINLTVKELTKKCGDISLQGDNYKALEYLNEAIDVDSTNFLLYYNRAQLCIHFDNLQASKDSLRKCLDLLPDYKPAIDLMKEIEEALNRRYRMYQ